MKHLRLSLLLLLIGTPLRAQEAAGPPPDALAPLAAQRTPEELDQLLGPIALYPDALMALILPASTVPADVVLAARYLRENPGDRSQIENRAWDESVKSLANYPEVLKWMDDNLQWTKQVGEAFAVQPADVMQAVQRLRAKASAAGTLVDTPQQQVIAEPEVIRIVPAQPDVIYVPYYDPQVVFVERATYYPRPYLTFGPGVFVGSWLAYDFDWRRHTLWHGNRHRRWTGHDWHRPVVSIAPTVTYTRTPEVRPWRPPPQNPRASFSVGAHFRPEIARPVPLGLTSSRVNSFRPADPESSRSVVNPPAVPNSHSRGFNTNPRPDNSVPRTRPSIVTPPAATTETSPTPVAPPTTPPPQTRRNGGDAPRDGDTRGRNSRGNQINSAPVLNVAPATPIAPSAQYTSPAAPPPQRNYTPPAATTELSPTPVAPPSTPPQQIRRNGGDAPHDGGGRNSRGNQGNSPPVLNVAPATTIAPTAQYTSPAAPSPQRNYTRSGPTPAAASAPAQPAPSRSAPPPPPATTEPAASSSKPASPPTYQRGGGDRRNDNASGR